MAGDVSAAKQACREYCMGGLCVNFVETDYIYLGGEQTGFYVELINYPRFPSTPEDLWSRAKELSELLMNRCCQKSYTIMTPDVTQLFLREGDFR